MTLDVWHVHAGNLFGGVETILVNLAKTAAATPGVRWRFALCFEGRLADELRAAGADVRVLGATRIRYPWTVLRARRRLRRLLAAPGAAAAVCHSAWSQAIFGPVLAAARTPTACWLHGPSSGPHWLERWAQRSPADVLLCDSRYVAGSVGRIHPGASSEVLHPPVAIGPAPSPASRDALRAALGAGPGTLVILQMSRMEEWKGQAVLLEALGLLAERSDWVCWLAGGAQRAAEEAYERSLRRQVSALRLDARVKFLGQRSDVDALMDAADVFCQPNSAPEPFGIVFVHALARGVPVVGCATGGTPEIVDAECGRLVKPGNASALASTLGALMDDAPLRRRLGANGPERARELCDPQIQARKLAGILQGMASRGMSA